MSLVLKNRFFFFEREGSRVRSRYLLLLILRR